MMMLLTRRVVMSAAAVGAVLLLEGCGSSSNSNPCDGKEFTLVSQSLEGSSQISGSITQPKSMTLTSTASQNVMIDLEKVNLYQKMTMQVPVPINGKTVQVQAEFRTIFNAEKKVLVAYMEDTATAASPLIECKIMDLSSYPILNPATLSGMIKAVLASLKQDVKCTGDDGTYTAFKYSTQLPDPAKPLPVLPSGFKVSSSGSYEVDKDNLLHSADSTIEGQGVDGKVTVDGKIAAKFSVKKASLGGPKETDLDYSSWRNCTKEAPPSDLFDVLDLQRILTQANNSTFHSLVYGHALAGSPIPFLIRAIQDSSRSSSIEVV